MNEVIMNSKYASLILRVVVGGIILKEGVSKVSNIDGVIGFFSQLGLPSFTVYLVAYGELLGGIALIIGFYSRLAALLCMPIMLGATYFLATGAIPGPWQYPFLIAIVFLALLMQGGGGFAIKGNKVLNKIIPKILQD